MGAHRVVVITGASSGIGRATAHAFAREGADLVLAARHAAALEEAARECEALGARRAIAVPTDVTDARAVQALAASALESLGRIDIWVNNAGVVAFGSFEELSPAAFRRVVETNFFGCVHGARAVLPVFRAQGRGVLINMSSVLGTVGTPYASPYVASKFAIRGFSESLRQELRDAPAIRVCTVLPATVDTPIFRIGANYATRVPKAVEPVYDPAAAARAIVRLARRPRREAVAGGFGRLLMLGLRLTPGLVERLVAFFAPRLQFVPGSHASGPTNGNLFVPATHEHAVTGGWRRRSARPLLALAGSAMAALLLIHAGRAVRTSRRKKDQAPAYR